MLLSVTLFDFMSVMKHQKGQSLACKSTKLRLDFFQDIYERCCRSIEVSKATYEGVHVVD